MTKNVTRQDNQSLETKVIVAEVQRYLHQNLFFASSVFKDGQLTSDPSDPRPRLVDFSSYLGKDLRKGSTVSIPRVGRLYAQNKAEGVPITFQAPTTEEITLTVSSHLTVATQIEDYGQFFNNVNNYRSILKEESLNALIDEFERQIFSLFTSFSSSIGTGGGDILSGDDLREADLVLNQKNIPGNLRKYAVLTPEAYDKVRSDISRYDTAGDFGTNTLKTGKIQEELAGFRVVRSNRIEKVSGTAKMAAITDNAFCYGFACYPKYEEGRNLEALAGQQVYHMIFGVGVYRNAYGVLLNYDAINQ